MTEIKYKRQYLVAINELIRSYEHGGKPWDCPLCAVATETDGGECTYCPWMVVKGHTCMELHYAMDDVSERINRLSEWKEIYKR